MEVIDFGAVTDVGIDVPAIALMLPDVAWDGGALVLANEIVADMDDANRWDAG